MGFGILTYTIFMVSSIDEAIKGLQLEGEQYGSQIGCVLVDKDGNIKSQAHNSQFMGRRTHAEEIVIRAASTENFSNTTLYVTSEPCNGNPYHNRRHCCEQLVDAGIGRVVIGAEKRKYEGGLDYLKEHGITVEVLQHKNINYLCWLLIYSYHTGQNLSKRQFHCVYDQWVN